MATCMIGQAAIGGAVVGLASGMYMLVQGKVAGNSGALKSCVVVPMLQGERDNTNFFYLVGLLAAGVITAKFMPWAYEEFPAVDENIVQYAAGGFLTGAGTFLGNGCTSGHGLAGISRLSARSFVSTPLFMASAALAIMLRTGTDIGPMIPITATPLEHYATAYKAIAALAILATPQFLISDNLILRYYSGFWTGLTFGVGLAIGGMVRPSAVIGALGPARFDPSLWILFTTALVHTFIFYRIAEARDVKAARAVGTGVIDGKLILGSILFGLGWGITGMCPGPTLVGIGARPDSAGPAVMTVATIVGMLVAGQLATSAHPANNKTK